MTKPKKDEEAEILHPERTLALGGKQVTVRELTFAQEMQALPVAEPIIKGLAELFSGDEEPGFSDLEAVFYTHSDAFLALVAMATGEPESWISGLSGAEGQVLALTFWSVNRRFFISRVVVKSLEREPGLAESLSRSVTSTPL